MNRIKLLFCIDLRALALFRIGLALILLWDIFDRLADVAAHYSDVGIFPRSLAAQVMDPWNLSLNMISGAWQIQLILFMLYGLCAIALLLGYKTRWATFLSWILLTSLHARNPLVLQGGDVVLRLLLFWALFLPLDQYFSVEKKEKTFLSNRVLSIATIGVLLQVCFIYWFSALLKNDPIWRTEWTAVWYAFNIEQYTKPLGAYLLNFPELLKILTFSTFYLEALGPFFAFIPFFRVFFRTLTAFAFIFFHLIGLNLTMELAHFPYICALGWMLFLPTEFWDKFFVSEKDAYDFTRAGKRTNYCALFFLIFILVWNLGTMDKKYQIGEPIASLTRVDQYWNMFSPYPLREDGWYVIPAKLKSGKEIDLFTGKEVTYQKPSSLAKAYSNDRWRSYLMNLFLQETSHDHFLYYARYLTRTWNQTHSYEDQVQHFQIQYMLKITTKNGVTEPEKILLWEHDCEALDNGRRST